MEVYRSEMNDVAEFVDERIELDPDSHMKMDQMYNAFLQWTRDNGRPEIKKRELGKRLRGLGLAADRLMRAAVAMTRSASIEIRA